MFVNLVGKELVNLLFLYVVTIFVAFRVVLSFPPGVSVGIVSIPLPSALLHYDFPRSIFPETSFHLKSLLFGSSHFLSFNRRIPVSVHRPWHLLCLEWLCGQVGHQELRWTN